MGCLGIMATKTFTTMTIEEVKPIIDVQMSDEFDSHDFIKEYIWQYPKSYGELLCKYENVRTAHSQIGKFLLQNTEELGIEKNGENGSDDIFGHPTPCAKWKKLSK